MNTTPSFTRALCVVAFDGILADTLEPRARVLNSVARDFPELSLRAFSASDLAGHTFAEAIRAVATAERSVNADETLIDLYALDAERAWASEVALGVVVFDSAIARLVDLAAVHRVVIRSDSTRGNIAPAVQLLEEAVGPLTVVAADDPAVRYRHGAPQAVALRQYALLFSTHALREVTAVEHAPWLENQISKLAEASSLKAET